MGIALALFGVGLIAIVLADCFETMLQPRRVTRPYRMTRFIYRVLWLPWRALARRLKTPKRQNAMLAMFGPLSLVLLLAAWAATLIFAFALVGWSLRVAITAPAPVGLGTYLYLSGVTLFTLGYGDVTAVGTLGRTICTIEAGLGFGLFAVVISYLPALSQAYSTREIAIGKLDARAGSPPTAGQMLTRLAQHHHVEALDPFLREWETWSASVLESHLAFPVLALYRSQHDNQSWLAAITAVLDACTVLISSVEEIDIYQAQLTFAMARHTVVDLVLVFNARPSDADQNRFSADAVARLRAELGGCGIKLREGPAIEAKMAQLRYMYEPFVASLADFLVHRLPPLLPEVVTVDNWQTSAWQRRAPDFQSLGLVEGPDEHFG